MDFRHLVYLQKHVVFVDEPTGFTEQKLFGFQRFVSRGNNLVIPLSFLKKLSNVVVVYDMFRYFDVSNTFHFFFLVFGLKFLEFRKSNPIFLLVFDRKKLWIVMTDCESFECHKYFQYFQFFLKCCFFWQSTAEIHFHKKNPKIKLFHSFVQALWSMANHLQVFSKKMMHATQRISEHARSPKKCDCLAKIIYWNPKKLRQSKMNIFSK